MVAESKEGSLFRSEDGGESFKVVNTDRGLTTRGYYYCDLRVDPKDENRVYVLEGALQVSTDGGQTFSRIGSSVHGDLQALWIDPQDPARMWQGSDGGLASSWDMGKTWQHVSNISLGQFYHVYADNRKPFYYVSGGTQDNGTWIGPSQTREPSGILNDDWRMISAIVGFNVLSESGDPDVVLTQTPGGTLLRTDLRTRDQQSVGPQVRNNNGVPIAQMKYRFAWDPPLVRSAYGKDTYYFGSNVIFQSSDQGSSSEPISHDLTQADPEKWKPSGGPIFTDSPEIYGAVTRISESSVKRGVIWAGTDDGNIQVTENGGGQWVNVASNVKGVPAGSPVSALETSHRSENVVYAAFDRHMLDDMRPHLFKTSDMGKTWTSINQGLPANAFIWVIREDLKNPDVLYLGTEVGPSSRSMRALTGRASISIIFRMWRSATSSCSPTATIFCWPPTAGASTFWMMPRPSSSLRDQTAEPLSHPFRASILGAGYADRWRRFRIHCRQSALWRGSQLLPSRKNRRRSL